MSKAVRAPLFHQWAEHQPSWITRASSSLATVPAEPPLVVSLSAAFVENVTHLMRPFERKIKPIGQQARRHAQRMLDEAERYLPWAPLPANRVWIEEAEGGGRGAIYVDTFGSGLALDPTHCAFIIRRNGGDTVADFTIAASAFGSRFTPYEAFDETDGARISYAAFQLQLAIICAMLSAPGIRVASKQVKEKRLALPGMRAPMISYSVVDFNIDALADNPERGAPHAGGGSPKAKHRVRGHPRFQEGKWTQVRPHWRGSLKYGLKLRDMNACRDEEMH